MAPIASHLSNSRGLGSFNPLLPSSIPPSSYTPEPCHTLSKTHGPIALMLQTSHTMRTLARRRISQGVSSAGCSTVRPRHPHLPARLSVLISFGRLVLGIATVVFFRCMTGLFDPAHRRGERVKWGLVSYTTAMFSILTVLIAISSNIVSIMFIDSRQFPGVVGLVPPGPYGYLLYISPMAISALPDAMVILNNWLADGLLVSSLFEPASTHPAV